MGNKNIIYAVIVVVIIIAGALFFMNRGPSETTETETPTPGEEQGMEVNPQALDATVSPGADFVSYNLVLEGAAPQQGEAGTYGYGVLTEAGTDAVMAITSHAGWRDSELQQGGDDPAWHVHYVRLGEVELCGENPGVIDLNWEAPGEVTINGNEITVSNVPTEFEGSHSVTGESVFFSPGTNVQGVVQFDLEPVTVDEGVAAVCVTNITEVPFTVASEEGEEAEE